MQVKTVCTFIGAQAMIDTEKTGGRNPLVELAQQLDFLGERTPEERAAEEELDRIRGPKVADRIEDDPRFSAVSADPDKGVEASNPEGSFEAMIRMFTGGVGPPAMPGAEAAIAGDGGEDGEPAGQLRGVPGAVRPGSLLPAGRPA